MDTDFHPIIDKDGNIINYNQPVIVGDHVWIGANSQVLKGSIIPEGTIVAAGSTVASKISGSHSIIGGVPARVLRSDVYWSLGMVPPPPDGGGGV
jgi:acetyltransferase-like isoleucine patch superfamily enzyme